MWQASNPCTRLEYAMPENQPLVQNFRFTGKSVSSDSIRACSHKVLSPPISHATSLPAQCRRSRLSGEPRAVGRRAGLGSIRPRWRRAREATTHAMPRHTATDTPLKSGLFHPRKEGRKGEGRNGGGENRRSFVLPIDEKRTSPRRARKRATKRCSRSVGIMLKTLQTGLERGRPHSERQQGRANTAQSAVRRSDLIFPRGANQMGNRRCARRRKRGAFRWRWRRRRRRQRQRRWRRTHESVMRRRTNFGRAGECGAAQRSAEAVCFSNMRSEYRVGNQVTELPTIQ